MKVHHIGYLVKNIEKAQKSFTSLGYVNEGEVIYDESRGIDILFMNNDSYRIELVSPKSEDSVVYGTLKKLGNTPYHICYEVEDIEKALEELRNQGYTPASEIEPAPAIEGRKVCFAFNRSIGIIELVECKQI